MRNSRSLFDTTRLAAASLWLAALYATDVPAATTPPDMPLPECIYVAGKPAGGACPALGLRVSGNAAGRLGAGQTIVVNTVPAIGVCDSWNAYTKIWTPSGCYAEVGAPTIVSCGVIDLRNENQYREMPCGQALYKDNVGVPNLFTLRRPAGSEDPNSGSIVCGAVPNYHTYVYGGPANKEEAVWRTRGPAALKCGVTFNGPRPDGMIGPTWAKIRVRINYAETPDIANGSPENAEFFVPIDGDLRDVADVDIAVAGSMVESNWNAGRLFANYKVTLTNAGDLAAEKVEMTTRFPQTLIYQNATGATCDMSRGSGNPDSSGPMNPGGTLTCRWDSIEGHGSANIDVLVRISNATDMDAIQRAQLLESYASEPAGVRFEVRADNDVDSANNEFVAQVELPFRSGSYEQTRSAMETLAPYFNYTTDKKFKTCNVYKDDIAERLEQIHADHPEVFANLSWGRITSGQYLIAGQDTSWTRAGHVGVVVYTKGTNFRETGIVINGTPSPSPLPAVSEVGPQDTGLGYGVGGWTGLNGYYLRTPANKFPGHVQREGSGNDGFEGRYPNNAAEFMRGSEAYPAPPPAEPVGCPIAPDAMTVNTQSPVELIITNSKGQHIETQDGRIITQELAGGIFSMALPHDDGTFAWTIALPVDDYDVKVKGTRTGTYRLTLTTFDADGKPLDKVTDGSTTPGQVDQFALDAPDLPPPPPPPPPTTPDPPAQPPAGNGGNGVVVTGKKGGGGSLDGAMLTALLMTLLLASRAGRAQAR